ncbi:virulence RhuM family protein [Testudinibacter sp. TR-2022]|uniref:virulence RhuM family protein n=1 Tax=Testudinibacter sp. TR-2022 TaxID=2585029 RepID=UPI00111B74EA|nr:virulence RhuM family protein [Testudinibacter sp. TR-2022]TNH06809.1 virulence RhuM family protein [Pasteurellaceae bacterium Phil11]TNH24148.1 virulence RhuM family protein [Testudinibacter sp. TR-2022]TNH27610.1 virulence RhuM family protein [Testudinibacter sp. TR-2022]
MQPGNLIIYNTDDGKSNVALFVQGDTIWLSQARLAELFDTSVPNIAIHIKNILEDKELDEFSVIKDYLITAADGKQYKVKHYALEMILAVGFRVRSPRGVQFRRWANQHLRSYLQKGFLIDSERLKNPNGRPDYFDELLEQIRDIRASEMRFYQKIRDLFRLSSDYDPSDKATEMFFAETQNKLLYAATGKTAAELVCSRADANQPNMGLQAWKGKVVRKGDIIIAKNYLNADEIDTLNRLSTIFLESAELQVKNRRDLTLAYWRNNVEQLLAFNGFEILTGKGSRNREQMKSLATAQYELFDNARKQWQAAQAEAEDVALLDEVHSELKSRQLGGLHKGGEK